MKIIVILESRIDSGGGFNQSLNAILQLKELSNGKYELSVITTQKENLEYLKSLKIQSEYCSYSLVDAMFAKVMCSSIWRVFIRKIKFICPFEKKLFSNCCDLVYFVNPSIMSTALQKLNFIMTVWDLCHRDHPEFPEVREYGQLIDRDYNLDLLKMAFRIIVDSTLTQVKLNQRYGIDIDKIIVMPFSPSPFLTINNVDGSHFETKGVLKKYGLTTGYFFYPAQFWAHKNHVRILEAINILKDKGVFYKVVFCGGNQGNLKHIRDKIQEMNLQDQVAILGFVPSEDMVALYKESFAVIMPTYFGPTNLPPLEAWQFSRPLICSVECQEQVGDAALCFNPDSADEIASSMELLRDERLREELISRGHLKLQEIEQKRRISESYLLKDLDIFSVRRKCWK